VKYEPIKLKTNALLDSPLATRRSPLVTRLFRNFQNVGTEFIGPIQQSEFDSAVVDFLEKDLRDSHFQFIVFSRSHSHAQDVQSLPAQSELQGNKSLNSVAIETSDGFAQAAIAIDSRPQFDLGNR
jgi:hypothetical protein